MKISRQVRAIGRIAVTWGVAFSALAAAAVGIGLAFHALPPDFDGERGIEAGVSFGYGLYSNTSERLFWTQTQAVI